MGSLAQAATASVRAASHSAWAIANNANAALIPITLKLTQVLSLARLAIHRFKAPSSAKNATQSQLSFSQVARDTVSLRLTIGASRRCASGVRPTHGLAKLASATSHRKMVGFHLRNRGSRRISVAPPSASTSTRGQQVHRRYALQAQQVDQQQRDHRDHQHRGGDVDAAQLVGHEKRRQWRKVNQGLHP